MKRKSIAIPGRGGDNMKRKSIAIPGRGIVASRIVSSKQDAFDWSAYYEPISGDELADMLGLDSADDLEMASNTPGNSDLKHIDWIICKDEYVDILSDYGYDWAELVNDGGSETIVQVAHDMVYPLEEELSDLLID